MKRGDCNGFLSIRVEVLAPWAEVGVPNSGSLSVSSAAASFAAALDVGVHVGRVSSTDDSL